MSHEQVWALVGFKDLKMVHLCYLPGVLFSYNEEYHLLKELLSKSNCGDFVLLVHYSVST